MEKGSDKTVVTRLAFTNDGEFVSRGFGGYVPQYTTRVNYHDLMTNQAEPQISTELP